MKKENIFKASSVELATKQGLEQLGLTEDEAEIEVISNAGIFSKAQVKITKKGDEVEIDEKVDEEIDENDAEEEQEKETLEEKTNYRRERPYNRERRERVDSIEKIEGKKFLETIISYLPVSARVDAKEFKDELCFYIGGENASYFIGHRGEMLDAIQYITSQFINKNKSYEEQIRVTVDADFYRERRKKTLTNLAIKKAKTAIETKRDISLEPMNSYERRIIHFALQNSTEVTTRSEGEGKDRHVIISPLVEEITYGISSSFRRNGPNKGKTYGGEKKRF